MRTYIKNSEMVRNSFSWVWAGELTQGKNPYGRHGPDSDCNCRVIATIYPDLLVSFHRGEHQGDQGGQHLEHIDSQVDLQRELQARLACQVSVRLWYAKPWAWQCSWGRRPRWERVRGGWQKHLPGPRIPWYVVRWWSPPAPGCRIGSEQLLWPWQKMSVIFKK